MLKATAQKTSKKISQGFMMRGRVVISLPPAAISKGAFPRSSTSARPGAVPATAPIKPRMALSTRKISLIFNLLNAA
jgi:hypothetical protein